jgi:triacylglycerol lipase
MAVEDLKAAALEIGPTNPFAVSYLQLCQVSYLPAAQIPAAIRQVPPLNSGGYWACAWGPAQNSIDANLVFVATYYYGPNQPVFAATVIRGTDADITDGWGIIEQIWEDLDVTEQAALPWAPNSPARVAQGTLDALEIIQALSWQGQTLSAFLRGYLGNPANNQPVAIVTGHSLGGCLTTVVAPWLQAVLAQSGVTVPMVPATFAGPTAGNAAFAGYYDQCFRYALRYYNTFDVAPFAWSNLAAVETIYEPCGLSIPDFAYTAIVGMQDLMEISGVSYAQPATNNAPLTGRCYATSDWYAELAYQHHATTYMTLLGGTSVAAEAMPLIGHRRPRSTLHGRFGSAVALAKRKSIRA